MGYTILAVRTAQDDDTTLYPLVGDDRSWVEGEPEDGGPISWVPVTSLKVETITGGKKRSLIETPDVKANVAITACRFLVACEKWDKGGGWVGFGGAGVAVAVMSNAVSKARAAHRRKGKILLGQIRYPWVSGVGYQEKRGWTTPAMLAVLVPSPQGAGTSLRLNVETAKGVDVAVLARRLALAIAAHRLAQDAELTEEARAALELVGKVPPAPPEPKMLAMYRFPGHTPVPAQA